MRQLLMVVAVLGPSHAVARGLVRSEDDQEHVAPVMKRVQVEVAHRGSFTTDAVEPHAVERLAASGRQRLSIPAESLLQLQDVYTSLAEEPKSLGLPKRVQQAPELDQICVSDPVGGAALAGDPVFQEQAQRGHRAAASKSIVFGGLLRDIGDSAPRLLGTLRKAASAFARYHILLLENNSKDGTRVGLNKECKSRDVWCFELDLPNTGPTRQDQHAKSRVAHLVGLRQSLLEQVRRFTSLSPAGPAWDFLVLFDGDMFAQGATGFHPSMLDALLGFPAASQKMDTEGPSSLSEASTVVAEAPWDVVCANQLANWPTPGRYRDTFALRKSSWREAQLTNDDKTIYFSGNKFIPVKSCFSGLALYSMRALEASGCNYTFEDEDTCEHVTFHKCLAKHGHGKVAIFPPFTNTPNDGGVTAESCVKIGEGAHVTSSALELSVKPAITTSTRSERKEERLSAVAQAEAKPSWRPKRAMRSAPGGRPHAKASLLEARKASVRAQRAKSLKRQLQPKTMRK